MPTFRIATLGCKVNQYDGEAVAEALRARGLESRSRGTCGLLVINTCCVTRTAMAKSRRLLRSALRAARPRAVLVTGCYADYDPARLQAVLTEAGAADTTLICGHHGDLADALDRAARLAAGDAPDPPAEPVERPGPGDLALRRRRAAEAPPPPEPAPRGLRRFGNRQRAFVKVQDGCDAFCSYCIVPFSRARVHSRPKSQVLEECRRLIDNGHREIVLCGVFLGAWGRSTARRGHWPDGPQPLADLLAAVARLPGLWRLRLSSLEPGDLTDELLGVLAGEPACCPHLHLPLQSGSGRILRAMNRQYGPEAYLRSAERLRTALDRPALSSDVIVGFPGEDEEDFQQTLEVVARAGLTRVHAFPFSAIEPTAASRRVHEAPPGNVVRERIARLDALADAQARDFAASMLGECCEGLVEPARRGDGPLRRFVGARYQVVRFPAPRTGEELTGRIVRTRIEAFDEEGPLGGSAEVLDADAAAGLESRP
jgi:threonylcarbamoyladenosine tRNA methylthiotransferase MtaB